MPVTPKPTIKGRLEAALYTLEEIRDDAERLLPPPVAKALAGVKHADTSNPYGTLLFKPDFREDQVLRVLTSVQDMILYGRLSIKNCTPPKRIPIKIKKTRGSLSVPEGRG